MRRLRFRILNVFAETRLGGNPLCVFEEASGLDTATMQALALQFNLSETTFILPPEDATADARVRIFTPTFEMPFAGHPTLGTAHVVRALRARGDRLILQMAAGLIPVTADADTWTLRANQPQVHEPDSAPEELAHMLGLPAASLASRPLWVDTGSEQLMIPVASAEAVHQCAPNAEELARHSKGAKRGGLAYVFARTGADSMTARFFFLKHGAVVEDPGTGSACANLGGWLMAMGQPLPARFSIEQGAAVGRPCRLGLTVDADRNIFVSGRVIELGSGEVAL